MLEIESDRFQNLSYSEAAFQTEAGAVYGEYRKSRTDPEFALEEQLMATAFEKHTYGHTTMGFERDIAAMPKMYDYSRSFFARYYRPENTVLFVSGDVTPEGVLPLVEKYYGGWKRGYVAPQIPVEPEQRAERRVDVQFDGQTLPVVAVAYKLPAFAPADRTRVAARPPHGSVVRRDERDLSAARARGAGRGAHRRVRAGPPRPEPAHDQRAREGSREGRLRARRDRRDGRGRARLPAGRGAARGAASNGSSTGS